MKKGTEYIFRAKELVIYHQHLPKKQLKVHRHGQAHLFIPLAGEMEIDVDSHCYRVSFGKMLYVGSAVDHSFQAKGELGERLVIQMEPDFLPGQKLRTLPVALLAVNPLLKKISLELMQYAQAPFLPQLIELWRAVFLDCLQGGAVVGRNLLLTTQRRLEASQSPSLKLVLSTMRDGLTLPLEEIAQKAGLSLRAVSRLVREEIGLSPLELLTYFRIEKACAFIMAQELNLTAIAYECGYQSLSQFIANFKKWTGVRPSEFLANA